MAVLSTGAGASAAPPRAPCRLAGSSGGRWRAVALGERDSQLDAPGLRSPLPHLILSSRYHSFLKGSHSCAPPPPSTPPNFFYFLIFFNVLLLHGGLSGWASRVPTRSRKVQGRVRVSRPAATPLPRVAPPPPGSASEGEDGRGLPRAYVGRGRGGGAPPGVRGRGVWARVCGPWCGDHSAGCGARRTPNGRDGDGKPRRSLLPGPGYNVCAAAGPPPRDLFAVGSDCRCVVERTARRLLVSPRSSPVLRATRRTESEKRPVQRRRPSLPRRRYCCRWSDPSERWARLWGHGVLCCRIPLFREPATVRNELRGGGNSEPGEWRLQCSAS